MGEKRCYYEVLGVDRAAAANDIRKAYKKLALQYHPDRNNGSQEATARFKEVTEAYQVLSDDAKRARYDQFGHAGVEGSVDLGGDIFSHFQDLFGDFFGGFAGFGGARPRGGPIRGRDLRYRQELTLEQAVLGCKKDIDVTTPVECEQCHGTGSQPGSKPKRCATCAGAGQVSTGRGFIMFTQTCPSCQGQGSVIDRPCTRCDGAGFEEKRRTVTVSFPAGIDEGLRLRVPGQGLPGRQGGPPGHLYVDVTLAPHPRFERQGDDLVTNRLIGFPEATLGTVLEVELLDGSTQSIEVPAGTQPGHVISVAGKGAPRVNSRARGTLHVVIQVAVPTGLSRRAKKLLRELQEELAAPAEAVRTA